MKNVLYTAFFLLFIGCNNKESDRLVAAKKEKDAKLNTLLQSNKINTQEFDLYIRVFKLEQILEVWAKNKAESSYKKVISYPFCVFSGNLGPKRKEGDRQIPEGFYHIAVFNPSSNFHLSLGINYPNTSDAKLGDTTHLGGDIYIHGGCMSIGCIPLTDDKIKELYVLAERAKKSGQQKIRVDILPFDFSKNTTVWKEYPEYKEFWQSLQPFQLAFEKNYKPTAYKIDENGRYIML